MKKIILLLPCIAAMSAVIFAILPDVETVKVMSFVTSKSYCKPCHSDREVSLFENPAQACDAYCATCHASFMSRHHSIGMRMKKNPEGITLTKNKRVACISCHDLNIRRYDSVPWKSESLFGSLFNSKPAYETYYLAARNNDGALCYKCHAGRKEK
jgi:hypothetical protein